MTCSKCGSPMRLMNGQFGKFYSCSKYPDCKNISSYNDAPEKNAYHLLCIHKKFDSIFASTIINILPNEIGIEFIGDNNKLTEHESSMVFYKNNRINILLNNYYAFKNNFDMVAELYHKYLFISLYFKEFISIFKQEKLSNPDYIVFETEYYDTLDEKVKKKQYVELSAKTNEFLNDIFMQVFNEAQPFKVTLPF